jgi:hypothetical protein
VAGWVYGLYESDTGELKYIGSTERDPQHRLRGHIEYPTPRIREWADMLARRGARLVMIVLRAVADDVMACIAEGEELEKRAGLTRLLNQRQPRYYSGSRQVCAALRRWRHASLDTD